MTKTITSEIENVVNLDSDLKVTHGQPIEVAGKTFVLRPDFFLYVTEREVYTMLNHLCNEKEQEIKRLEYFRKINEAQGNPFENFEDYKKYVIATITKRAALAKFDFVYFEYAKDLLSELTAYFGGFHDRLKTLNPDKKGIMLVGGKGLGKTFIMRCFQSNPFQSFIYKTAKELATMAKDAKSDDFDRIGYRWYSSHAKNGYFGQNKLALFIDDIGTEDDVKSYGNTDNAIANIINHRYEAMKYTPDPNLFLTTNKTLQELEERYGHRCFDRLKEMVNFYVLPELDSLRA